MTSSLTEPSFFLQSQVQQSLNQRPRRNRQTAAIRGLVQETHLHPSQLVAPLFIVEGKSQQQIIRSMPGIFRYSLDVLLREVRVLHQLGIRAVDLFCYVPTEKKDAQGSEAVRPDNLLQQAIRLLKQEIPDMCLMVDIALDPFTNHGHDGIVNSQGIIDNDETLVVLGQMSVLAAEAGADIVAPSDMMDGRVAYIRASLDQAGFFSVGILSYAAKYASAFYGPFREALNSAPQFGDKKSYQMNPANGREALRECHLDECEGADMLLIKPALPYLDVLAKVRQATTLPLGAYHVSGEYAMVMAAAQNGWLDANRVFEESLIAIKRAGADFILTYAARQVAEVLNKKFYGGNYPSL
jgi:porphobilinogen synthase